MPLLSEKDSNYLREEFEKRLKNPVTLVAFTQSFACDFCAQTVELVQEVGGLSDQISVEVYDFVDDEEAVAKYGIDKIPAVALIGQRDYGVRFFGIPSGYEFTTLIEDIFNVSDGDSGLAPETRKVLAELEEEIQIQVFVTPTCPYCTQAVRLAHQMAIESDLVTGVMVESTEFPHLANKYEVMGVPRSIFNETVHQEGAVPEAVFLARVLQAAGKLTEDELEEMFPGLAAPVDHDHDHDHEGHDHH